MLRIPSRWCQATRSHTKTMSVWICHKYGNRKWQLEVNAWHSPIKSSTKVPLTLARPSPTLRSVGHRLPCGIGESLSKEGAVEVCAYLIQ
jgi:hypothetical protein